MLHPTSPFGLPLDFQTLPEQLKKVGKPQPSKIRALQLKEEKIFLIPMIFILNNIFCKKEALHTKPYKLINLNGLLTRHPFRVAFCLCSSLWLWRFGYTSFCANKSSKYFSNSIYKWGVFLKCFLSGYATHLVGKWHLGFYKWPYVPTNRGFDSAYGFWDGAEDHYDHTRDKVVDFRNGTEPVLDLNGKYATFEYVKV